MIMPFILPSDFCIQYSDFALFQTPHPLHSPTLLTMFASPSPPPALLFTAFEPSGDQLAAPVIARLKALRLGQPVFAIGGPRMQAAGATLLETTGAHAAMALSALKQAAEHRRRLKRLATWLAERPELAERMGWRAS